MKKKHIIDILKFFGFLSIGLAILYYVYFQANKSYQAQRLADGLPPQDYLVKLGEDIGNANYFWLFMVALAFLASNVSRALRWKMLLDPLKLKEGEERVRFINPFLAVLLGYFVNLFIPRAGEVARSGVITMYEKITIDKVIGTVAVDRILDAICLLCMMLLALALEFDILWGYLTENAFKSEDGSGGGLPTWLFVSAGLGVLAVVLFFIFRKRLQQLAIYKKIEGLVLGFVEGLRAIQQLEKPWLFVFHTVFIWLMYYLMLYLAFFSFEPTAHLGPVTGLLVFVFGALGMVIPSPGGMGSYQFLVTTALSQFYGIEWTNAFSFSNIAFTAPQLCNIGFGLLAYILLPLANRKA